MDTSQLEKHINLSIGIVLGVAVAIVGGYFYWFSLHLHKPLSVVAETWGQFGDFVGGVLNPMVAFAAFFWLVKSVRIQKTELEETRTALEASKAAQEEQARLALLAAKTQSWNTRLNSVNERLVHLRASRARVLAHGDSRGYGTAIVQEDGSNQQALVLLKELNEKIQQDEKRQNFILKSLAELEDEEGLHTVIADH